MDAAPSTDADMLGHKRPGAVVAFSASLDGWLRTAEPVQKGQYGWALESGARLGLKELLIPVPV